MTITTIELVTSSTLHFDALSEELSLVELAYNLLLNIA